MGVCTVSAVHRSGGTCLARSREKLYGAATHVDDNVKEGSVCRPAQLFVPGLVLGLGDYLP